VQPKNQEEKMRNFFSKHTLILLLFSFGFALICSYLLLEEFTTYTLTATTFSYAWLLQMILIQLLGFTEKTKKKLSIASFFISLFTLVNLSVDIFLSFWKYELILFIGLLFSYWLIKLKSQIHQLYFLFLLLSTTGVLAYIAVIIHYNQFNEIYFYWARILLIGLIILYFATGLQRLFKKVP
jgi:hypothetical protein